MAITITYTCSDGKTFSTLEEAKSHEEIISNIIMYDIDGNLITDISDLMGRAVFFTCKSDEAFSSLSQNWKSHFWGYGKGTYFWVSDNDEIEGFVKIDDQIAKIFMQDYLRIT